MPQTIEGAFAKGAHEMIVVLPDSKTVHNGSMYSSSVTTGDFENYVARDVVAYIDAHYRTIASRESRGLVGHSMGGYGATRIGMKHADVFGSLYIMSPCCLSPRGSGGGRGAPAANAANDEALAAVKTPADSAKLPFGLRAQLASAAAWSPNPKNPPLYLDLPIGDQAQAVLAKWAANAPLAFIDQYILELKRYRAIAIDVGDQDGLRVDAGKLHDVLDQYGIANTLRDLSGDAHQRRRRSFPGARDAVLQPDAVVRAGEAMTRFGLATAAMLLAIAPTLALDGQPAMHDPSTVIEAGGKFYVYATGNGLPAFQSDDGWTWHRTGSVMQAVPGGKPGPDVIARGGNNTWAPDIIRSGDKYFLYYAAPGTQPKAAMGLLVGRTLDPASPDYKWEDGGPGRLVRRRRGQQRDRSRA